MRSPINTMVALAATTTTAFAANGGQTDDPGILGWAFLGFCAVIFAGQLVPAAMMVYGAAKALFAKAEAKGKA